VSAVFRSLLTDMPGPDEGAAAAVRDRAGQVLRPNGALRRLDDAAVHIAAWNADPQPSVEQPAILVFAADHGVAAAGVSNYPSDITAAMLAAVEAGQATINAYARSIEASLDVIDVGVGTPTADIRSAAAMSPERFDEIASTAVAAVDRVAAHGADLLVLGELGIGNTTIAAALSAALIGGGAGPWVGRGTGVDDEGLERKRAAVEQAVARVAGVSDPLEVMRQVGGAELTAMAAACARARHHRLPVVLDGYIATAAVLPMHEAAPGALDHCIAGHVSAEPGHRAVLQHIGKQPLLDLDLRLGEGTGGAATVPIIRLACAGVVEVATFDEWFGA